MANHVWNSQHYDAVRFYRGTPCCGVKSISLPLVSMSAYPLWANSHRYPSLSQQPARASPEIAERDGSDDIQLRMLISEVVTFE